LSSSFPTDSFAVGSQLKQTLIQTEGRTEL